MTPNYGIIRLHETYTEIRFFVAGVSECDYSREHGIQYAHACGYQS